MTRKGRLLKDHSTLATKTNLSVLGKGKSTFCLGLIPLHGARSKPVALNDTLRLHSKCIGRNIQVKYLAWQISEGSTRGRFLRRIMGAPIRRCVTILVSDGEG